MKNYMKVNPVKWIELAASKIESTLHSLEALHDSGDVGSAVKDDVELLEDFVKVAGLPSKSFKDYPGIARLSFPGKGKDLSSTFINLMQRCIEHEFDVSVEVKHIHHLSADIDTAYIEMDISETEYNRLQRQLDLTKRAVANDIVAGLRK